MALINFIPLPVFKTERLTLRQLNTTDASKIFSLRSNKTVNKYLDRKPAESIEDAKNFIEAVNENIGRNESLYWAITLTDSNELVGTICLFAFSADGSTAEIGYELLPDFQRKGIMSEALAAVIDFAFNGILIQTIEAFMHRENIGSKRLLEKFDFKNNGAGSENLLRFTVTKID